MVQSTEIGDLIWVKRERPQRRIDGPKAFRIHSDSRELLS